MAIRTEDHSDLKKFGNRLWYVMTGMVKPPRIQMISNSSSHLICIFPSAVNIIGSQT